MTDGRQGPEPGSYGGPSFSAMVVAPITGEGYSLDPAGLEHVAKEFEALAEEIQAGIRDARTIAQTESPAFDYASGNNAEVFRNSGDELVSSLQDRMKYCRDQAAKFKAARGRYATAEDTHSTEAKKVGGTL
ncbi:PE domain-containing protein [Amycolatopsis panacis]|nr:PE domain-containing protein [Amycolatopsis panacis]